jgi:hypothetical protein
MDKDNISEQGILELLTEYVRKHGFHPNTIIAPESTRRAFQTLLADDVAEDNPVASMMLRFDDKATEVTVAKEGVDVARLRPREAKAMYMPMADITNMLPSILSAAFHSIDPEELDPDRITTFINRLIAFMTQPPGDKTWEKDILPETEAMLRDLSHGESFEFLSRFFFCLMDFYWYCIKHIPKNALEAEDYSSLIKTVFARSLVRSVETGKQKAVIDELTANGKFPDNTLD